jgi:hypothetical protein
LVTARQAPVAHDRQAAVQAALQHRLSLQNPVAHSFPVAQVSPVFFLHTPLASQVLVPEHSGLSSAPVTWWQVPPAQLWQAASQAAVQHTPSRQKPVAHSVPAPQVCPIFFLQTPAASHVIAPVHSGLSSLEATVVQLPVVQVWHAAVHAEPQQTPSLQKPLAQSPPVVQVWPTFFLQLPVESQVLFPVHSGASSVPETETHVPVLQLRHGSVHASLQQAPSLQKPLPQSPGWVQLCPPLRRHTPDASQV